MSGKSSISNKEQRLLHTKSGNRCAMCRNILVEIKDGVSACIGENAHIYGEKETAARFDATRSNEFVNSEKNLIFLCCNCHKKIDTEVLEYPVGKLFRIKSEHENWVAKKLAEKSVAYGFGELEVLSKYLMSSSILPKETSSYDLLKIDKKIQKNELRDVRNFITMGLSSMQIIEDYLNKNIDAMFSRRLTTIMSDKYNELKESCTNNYDVFYELWSFASGNSDEFIYKAAGLGILTYFFEKCEVFEK